MTTYFARIYGNGIVALADLPDSLRHRDTDIQELVDIRFHLVHLWQCTCLRIDCNYEGDIIVYLMESIAGAMLK